MGLLRRLFGGSDTSTDARLAQAPEREPSWYVPVDEGDETRFVGPDGMPALHLVEHTDYMGGVGFRLCEDSTGLLVSPTDRRLPKIGLLVSNLKGEFYNQPGTTDGDYMPGRPVTLIPEPTNPHDDRAVMVCDGTGAHKCGYVNKQQARRYLKRLAAGDELEAMVLFHRMEGPQRVAVQVLVGAPGVLAYLRGPRPEGSPAPAHLR
jgi:hypothetical protein